MATNYQRGRQFEYRTRDKLLKNGAVYVMRAASSKGAADLIALWPVNGWLGPLGGTFHVYPRAWLVQCKRDGKLPRAERETLVEIAAQTGATPVLARVPKAGRGVEFVNIESGDSIG